uniref:putative phage tail protein n=1 Tax=Candidatus Fimivicinus sp. TaxID=3056640 RepID=UPI003FEDE547
MPALEQMKQMLLPLRLYILSPESRVYAELCAYAQGLEAAQQRLDQLMEAAFIQTAPADRLAVWERILGLPAQSEGPLERRAAILARLSLGPPGFTRAETESLLEQAGFSGSQQEDCAAATLRLRFGGRTISFALCAPMVPAIA